LETTDLYHRAQILLDQLKIQTVEIQNVLEGIRDQNRN